MDRRRVNPRGAVGDTDIGRFALAGTLNLESPVEVRVTAAGEGTALAGIAALMEAAAQGKSAYVRIADRASRVYAPAGTGALSPVSSD